MPVEITFCCSTAVPPEASLPPDWDATSATPSAAASLPPSAGASAATAMSLSLPLSLLALPAASSATRSSR